MELAKYALPTASAEAVLTSVGLLPKERDMNSVDEYDNLRDRLIEFQQMAMVCDIEDCMIAYHGIDITDEQQKGLDLVYKTTKPWLLGHVIGELLSLLQVKAANGKEVVESARMILDNLVEEGKVSSDNAEKLIINVYGQQKAEES